MTFQELLKTSDETIKKDPIELFNIIKQISGDFEKFVDENREILNDDNSLLFLDKLHDELFTNLLIKHNNEAIELAEIGAQLSSELKCQEFVKKFNIRKGLAEGFKKGQGE